MKQNRIVLGVAALVAAVMLPWPALGQDVGQQTVPGGVAGREDCREGVRETRRQGRRTGFRQEDRRRLGLPLGRPAVASPRRGTRVDFRVRLQHEIWHSDATLSLDDDSDVDNDNDLNADVARRRIGIEGEILNIFDYQVERELTANRDPWRDVYLNYKQHAASRR